MLKDSLFFLVFSMMALEGFAHESALVPVGSKEIAPHRFRSARSYRDTLKEMHPRLVGIKHMIAREEVNLPHVRAISFYNADAASPFSAVNIYTNLVTGVTEIFFVPKTLTPS